MAEYPRVSLARLLRRVKDEIQLEDDVTYKQVTVRLWNKGVILRGEQQGSAIKTKRQYRVQAGQIILSRIDVRNGAIGLVPPELDGAIISNDFWTYEIDATQIDPKFLALYVTTPRFIEDSDRTSSGTTKRIRADEDAFLRIEIPLPPLSEQQRIVARIEALARRVEEARGLRQKAVEEAEALWASSLAGVFAPNDSGTSSLEALCNAIIDNLHSTPKYDGDEFPCIRSQDVGWGTLNYSTALRTSQEEFMHRIQRGEPQAGDIVFVREGDIGRCATVDGSQRFCLGQRVMMFRPDASRILSKYMMHQLMSAPVLKEQILSGKTGTTSHHVNISHLRQIQVLSPSLNEQRRIVAYLDGLQARVDELKRFQAETQKELDALMSSVLAKAFAGEL